LQNHPINWEREFFFQKNFLFYNRIPYNHYAERAVEIPIAFDFLTHLSDKTSILEVGNVLLYYENSLSDSIGIRSRRIIDKFEVTMEVDNVDLMDLTSREKYHTIVSISTVEHVGQGLDPSGGYGEREKVLDLEAPLKAVVKIYDLLDLGGKAFITVPFGKLIDGGWYVQFSSEYLRLLTTKYGIPDSAISLSYLMRIAMERSGDNPRQLWVEAKEEELSNVEYNVGWVAAGAIALIELTKISNTFVLEMNVPPTLLVYETPVLIGSVYSTNFAFCNKPDANGVIYSDRRGVVFHGFYDDAPIGEYELSYSINVDMLCDLVFDVFVKGNGESILQSPISCSCVMQRTIKVISAQSRIEFQLSNRSGDKVKVDVQKFVFRRLKSPVTYIV
jgi:hypothetical protein